MKNPERSPMHPPATAGIIEKVRAIHRWISAQASALEARHRGRLQCRLGCSDCCRDDLSVFAIEAAVIRDAHASLLAEAAAPPGGCAFLNADGGCRIYANRPYVCRTQGLPLRWLSVSGSGAAVEDCRDICRLNEAGPPLSDLSPNDCWNIGPVERKLAELQALWQGAPRRGDGSPTHPKQLKRIALRSLFAKGNTSE